MGTGLRPGVARRACARLRPCAPAAPPAAPGPRPAAHARPARPVRWGPSRPRRRSRPGPRPSRGRSLRKLLLGVAGAELGLHLLELLVDLRLRRDRDALAVGPR